MKQALATIVENTSLAINVMAVAVIAFGTIEVFFKSLRDIFGRSATGQGLREWYFRYARWLIAGLTLQLAADIVSTATGTNWDEIGRLGAIAAIRTFLNFFLERDISEALEQQEKSDAKLGAR